MKRLLKAFATAILIVPAGTGIIHAGAIESACNQSGRDSATPALCRCIQQVGDMTLTRADQREAARFFRDPQRAQDVRMSTRERDSELWSRYRAFAETAEAICQ